MEEGLRDAALRGLGFALTAFLTAWVLRRIASYRKLPAPRAGRSILKFSPWMIWAGGIGTILGIGMLVLFRLDPPPGWIAALVISGLFLLSQMWLLLTALFVRVEYDEVGLTAFTFWRDPVSLYWSNIRKVDWDPWEQIRLSDHEGQTLRVHLLMAGLDGLVGTLEKRVAPELCREAVGTYRRKRAASGIFG